MSAIECGKRSFLFEDLSSPTSPPPASKRICCFSSPSPVRFSPPRSATGTPFNSSAASSNLSALDYLSALYPDMDEQLLERALKECGDDLDLAIRRLNEMRLGTIENLGSAGSKNVVVEEENMQFQATGAVNADAEAASVECPSGSQSHAMGGAEWVEFFVREMMKASNLDDARARATKVLDVFERSICARATTEASPTIQQENIMLKERMEALIHENSVLKRTVSIQHERQKELEDKTRELHHLKQLVSQYQEQLRTLEVNNYALRMHLKQAQQNNSISGRFHPDVF